MKKISMGIAMAAALVQMAYADDVPAQLNIQGVVTSEAVACSVYLDKTSVSLLGNTDELISQTDAIKTGVNVLINVASNYSENSMKCRDLADQGKLAYRFVGTADNADGISLANNNVTTSGAKGVGIGLYTAGTLVRVNQDTVTATSWGNTLSMTLVKLNGQQPTSGKVESTLTVQFERL